MLKKYQKLLLYLAILVFPLILVFSDQNSFTAFKFGVTDATLTPWKIISWPFKELKKILFYHQTHERYEALKREIGTLRSRLIGHEEVLKENNRYKKLLGLKGALVFSSVAANCVGRDPSSWNSAMILDRGEDSGIKVGMPVMSDLGVVGKIAEVSRGSSKVILVNDPNFSAAAIVQRSRENGLVSGTLQGICRLRYLNANADIAAGDLVITSKMSSSFPEGLLLGNVIGQEELESAAGEWLIEPAVELSQLEEVLVILK